MRERERERERERDRERERVRSSPDENKVKCIYRSLYPKLNIEKTT